MKLIDEIAASDAKRGLRAMDWERRYRTDPALRADMFVKEWDGSTGKRARPTGTGITTRPTG